MKRQEFHYLTNMKGYREFCHFVLYYDQKVLLRILWRCKKVEQIFLFCGLFMRKVHLQQFKEGTAKFQSRSVKGVPFVNEKYTKGVPFLLKMIYRRVRGWTSKGGEARGGGLPPKKALLSIHLPGLTMRAEVSFRYCQSRSFLFVYAPEQTTRLTGKAYDFVMLNTRARKKPLLARFPCILE